MLGVVIATDSDRSTQISGAAGPTADGPMAEANYYARCCHQGDDPEQVHIVALDMQLIRRCAC